MDSQGCCGLGPKWIVSKAAQRQKRGSIQGFTLVLPGAPYQLLLVYIAISPLKLLVRLDLVLLLSPTMLSITLNCSV